MKHSASKLFALGVLVLACTLAGYVAGRTSLASRTYRWLISISTPSPEVHSHLVPLEGADGSSTYEQLNEFLDAEIKSLAERHAEWKNVLRTTTSAERDRFARKFWARLRDSLAPWPETNDKLTVRPTASYKKSPVNISIIELDIHPNITLECALLRREDSRSPAPAILVLHGMYGNLRSVVEDVDYHHGFGFEMARHGFVVLAPMRVAATIETRNTLWVKAMAAGYNLETLDLFQLQRATDYLCSLPEVDTSKIGVYGISLGGKHALWHAALDERISLAVVSNYFTERFPWLLQRAHASPSRPPGDRIATNINVHDTVLFSPSMRYEFDDLNAVALIQPRHLAIVSGKADPRLEGAKREFENVVKLYDLSGHRERAEFIRTKGHHETSVEEVMPFIQRWSRSDDIATPRFTRRGAKDH